MWDSFAASCSDGPIFKWAVTLTSNLCTRLHSISRGFFHTTAFAFAFVERLTN